MAEIKLHNGKRAKNASLKELTRSIEWFSKTIEKFKKEGINLASSFEGLKSALLACRSDKIGKSATAKGEKKIRQDCKSWPNCSCIIRGNKLECEKHINSIRPY